MPSMLGCVRSAVVASSWHDFFIFFICLYTRACGQPIVAAVLVLLVLLHAHAYVPLCVARSVCTPRVQQ